MDAANTKLMRLALHTHKQNKITWITNIAQCKPYLGRDCFKHCGIYNAHKILVPQQTNEQTRPAKLIVFKLLYDCFTWLFIICSKENTCNDARQCIGCAKFTSNRSYLQDSSRWENQPPSHWIPKTYHLWCPQSSFWICHYPWYLYLYDGSVPLPLLDLGK